MLIHYAVYSMLLPEIFCAVMSKEKNWKIFKEFERSDIMLSTLTLN